MFSIIMTLFGKEVLKENYLEAASKVVVDFVEKVKLKYIYIFC